MNNIIYEDNHLLVCYKEQGVLSQQDKSNDLDILRMLKIYLVKKYNKPGEAYLGLVHRLDRNTSGIMVFAKTSKAANRLSTQIRESNFNKYYLAIVHGKLEKSSDTLVNKLLKDEKNVKSSVSNSPHALQASLEYDVIFYDRVKDLSVVKIKLHTGRHHQIRVQFSYIGHPLYADVKYGSKVKIGNYYPLCAYRLEIEHVTTKEKMIFINYELFLKEVCKRNILSINYDSLLKTIKTYCD